MTGYLHEDGSLILARWGDRHAGDKHFLFVDTHEKSTPMYGTKATGDDLVTNGQLGVDLIRVPAGGGFAPHTHPGDHLLIVVAGEGTITYEGRIYPTEAGQVYMVEGSVPHAVGAVTDHCILAVGSPHRRLDAADRMTLTEYASVAADLGRLHCLICDEQGTVEQMAAAGCPHTPAPTPTGRLLVVGLAPAGTEFVDRPAFDGTRSGDRLAGLLGFADTKELLDHVDTVNLFPDFVGDWQSIPPHAWKAAGGSLHDRLGGRVVVACGPRVAAALGGSQTVGAVELVRARRGPALVVTIPHPSGLNRMWNDDVVADNVRSALASARTLAAAGPPSGEWAHRDAVSLGKVTASIS